MTPTLPPTDLVDLRLELFEPLRGQDFSLHAPGPQGPLTLPVVLTEAKALTHPGVGGRHGFSLIFTGPAQPRWPQGLYGLGHSGWSEAPELFIVPVAADAQGVHYQAVFN